MKDRERRFFHECLKAVPELKPVYREHVKDFGQLLSYLALADMTHYLLSSSISHQSDQPSDALRRYLEFLELAYDQYDDRVRDLIAQSFVDVIDPLVYARIRHLLGPRLERAIAGELLHGFPKRSGPSKSSQAGVIMAFSGSTLTPARHFVIRLTDPCSAKLGIKTWKDLKMVFHQGNLVDADRGLKAFVRQEIALVLNPQNRVIITLRPWGMYHVRPGHMEAPAVRTVVGFDVTCPFCRVESTACTNYDIGWVRSPLAPPEAPFLCLGCCEDLYSACAAADFEHHPYRKLVAQAAQATNISIKEFRRRCLIHQLETAKRELEKFYGRKQYLTRLLQQS